MKKFFVIALLLVPFTADASVQLCISPRGRVQAVGSEYRRQECRERHTGIIVGSTFARERVGNGNFIYERDGNKFVLDANGVAWFLDEDSDPNTGNQIFVWRRVDVQFGEPNINPPRDTSLINSWSFDTFIDTQGNYWEYRDGSWHDRGSP